MKSLSLKLLVAALAGSALLATTLPAQARHDHRDARDGYRDWRHDHRDWRDGYRDWRHSPPPGDAYGHRYKHKQPKKVVVIRKGAPRRPAVVHHYHHYHHSAPSPVYYPSSGYYGHSRSPAIVIGVSVPPIVIPLR